MGERKIDSIPGRHRWTSIAVLGFLALFAFQLVRTAHANTLTFDEDDHIYAGYMAWKHGDFGLNPEHPPLVKFVATLPLLSTPLKLPPMEDRRYRLQAILGGKDFIFKNDADRIVFRAQMAASIFSLLLLIFAFFTAREMFGAGAGFIALGLLVFDPNLLAHGGLVTTDAGQACFLLASIYAFYRYIKLPSAGRLIISGCAVGLALASKHSAILLFPMLLVLAAIEAVRRRYDHAPDTQTSTVRHTLRLGGALVVISALAVLILWSSYGFRYAARTDGLHLNPPMAEQLAQVPSPAQAWMLGEFARWHLLPESYIYGFAHVLFSANNFNSYVFGKPYPHAVWFYFPVALLVKSSLTFLIFLALSVWIISSGRLRKTRELLFLLIPSVIYLAVSMKDGMNIGVRHILPVYIFLSLVIAGAAWALVQSDRRWSVAIVILLVFQAISVSRAFPNYIAYANEAFGGPRNVWKYLANSSADWGQQLRPVKRYIDEHQIRQCWFVYFGYGIMDYNYYGIPCKPLPTRNSLLVGALSDAPPAIDGPVFISANDFTGFAFGPSPLNPYEQFKALKPVATIDSSIFVYQGHFEIPLASGLAHAQKARTFATARKLPEALNEAQQAMALAPDSASVNASMGAVLDALGQREKARPFYENALRLSQTVEPDFQRSIASEVRSRLAEN
ncbi:MAG TPA: glycosyltransferase family 39 protein [Terriglobales bacterium]|nr:glycosyltransferase family 39 protein [Terriglobales bacterium]